MHAFYMKLAVTALAALAAPVIASPVTSNADPSLDSANASSDHQDSNQSATPDTSASSNGRGCQNLGTAWALFDNIAGEDTDLTYSNFNPSVYATQTPYLNNTAQKLGGLSGSGTTTTRIYGSHPVKSTNFVLQQVGYVVAKQSGVYTATINNDVDDIAFFWWGANAKSGFTRANANATLTYEQTQAGLPAQSAGVPAAKGNYIPFRFVFGQGGGPFTFNANITAPDGSLVLGPNSVASPQVVRFSCDHFYAPFPSW